VTSKVGCHEQHEELSLLRIQGAELCFVILGLSPVRTPRITEMRATTLRHGEVVGDLIALQMAVSSTVERVLECTPSEASRV
jgi:hypothetical protein